MHSDADGAWSRAALALQLLALDPFGLGGAHIRMRASPLRDKITANLPPSLATIPLHPGLTDVDLFGGLDLAATLQAGHVQHSKGVLACSGILRLSMAERCPADLAGKLAQSMDGAQQHCLILLDEGAADEECAPAALTDRVAFFVSAEDRPPAHWSVDTPDLKTPPADITEDQVTALVVLAARCGIDSARAALFAVRAARAHARLHKRGSVTEEDIAAAAALVYAHRATQIPDEAEPDTAPEPEQSQTPEAQSQDGEAPPQDMVVDAIRTALPDGLLSQLAPKGAARSKSQSNGAGLKRVTNRRGRPLPPRPGRPDGRARIDLIATLRTAAPWQMIRRKAHPDRVGLHILPSDIRLRRYQDRSDRLLIFTVDASGSAAVARLNEAKGAVELLLAEAYAKRDHVALISFRGQGADLLLPPTRSLVQTKRRLGALPGGGGTPLAAGLEEAGRLAQLSRGRGLSPTLVLLTDGRANIALDGNANRAAAQTDAETLAKHLRNEGTPSVVIDMGKRPSAPLADLSALLDGPYIPLPRANAEGLQHAVTAALDA